MGVRKEEEEEEEEGEFHRISFPLASSEIRSGKVIPPLAFSLPSPLSLGPPSAPTNSELVFKTSLADGGVGGERAPATSGPDVEKELIDFYLFYVITCGSYLFTSAFIN